MRSRSRRPRSPGAGGWIPARLAHARVRASRTAGRLRRSRLARRVALRRGAAVVLSVLVAWGVTGTAQQARRDRERWGSMERIAVATRDVAAGEVLDPTNTALEERPLAMVPVDALRTLPTGRRASVDVPDGEPLLRVRIADGSPGELAAQLPEGRAGVTFPRTEVQPSLAVGDRVDLYSSVNDVSGTVSLRVADAAVVVHLDAHSVTVAVAADQVRAAAAASLADEVAIVVRR